MSEVATAWSFMNRDRTKHRADVIGNYCGAKIHNSIVSKHSIGHYEQLWSGTYRSKSDYFDGHGWFDDLIGDFESEAAAIAAFEKLRDAIHAMDEQPSQISD
ncbi:hypothetical protein [Ferribacterium limneticum]|uniref:hypothetical protein n=1 Tax=Ferribacterium limneticum TaxID=76259 RepID=UPI001CFA3CAB|nr:hypothetical protein [Ferribacterium limneticum]UCV17231.1 hypothetical protein KI610_10250 [Ferribacterium limneticum]